MSAYPLDAALAAHPDWPRCPARSVERRDGRGHSLGFWACGYPLDPALGDVLVHPWCDQHPYPYGPPAVRQQRQQEALAARRLIRLQAMTSGQEGS